MMRILTSPQISLCADLAIFGQAEIHESKEYLYYSLTRVSRPPDDGAKAWLADRDWLVGNHQHRTRGG